MSHPVSLPPSKRKLPLMKSLNVQFDILNNMPHPAVVPSTEFAESMADFASPSKFTLVRLSSRHKRIAKRIAIAITSAAAGARQPS
jgi:hypothetical protein